MSIPTHFSFTHPETGVVYTLNAPAAAEFLRQADAFGDDCSKAFKRLRENLRRDLTDAGLLEAEGEVEVNISAHFGPSVIQTA